MPPRLFRSVLVALTLSTALLPPLVVFAQNAEAAAENGPATVIADSITVSDGSILTAEGNVEVFFQGRHLRAGKIVYNDATDRLQITGSLRFTDEDSATIILASQADLAADMTEGVLQSARIILDEKLQVTASEARRAEGRYTDMTNTVASSCSVCKDGGTPLWEIRAKRVLHDQQEQQLYFEQAQLRVAGIPLLYAPRLRMPDPTKDRANGFLTPTVFNSSTLGTGIRLPYFFTIGDSRDLTVTPLVTNANARSLDLRYRQAFRTGDILLQGALSRDDATTEDWRGYVTASGTFRLPDQFELSFAGQAVSDADYFTDYNLPEKDRLSWRVAIERTRQDESFSGGVTTFHTLRTDESNETQPSALTDLNFERRFPAPTLGGEAGLKLQAFSFGRPSHVGTDVNGDGVVDGRDVSRVSVALDWRRDWVTSSGLVIAALAQARGDVYHVMDDRGLAGEHSRMTGTVGVELRYPMVKRESATGATQVLEPVLQVMTSPDRTMRVPNEDSTTAEFDEGNLFSFSRFPGVDRVETGDRINAGVMWTRDAGNGWILRAAGGRVYREAPVLGFNSGSGQEAATSDWLGALRLSLPYGLNATGRGLLADDLALTRGELNLGVEREKYDLTATYLWAAPDISDAREDYTSEMLVGGGVYVSPQWRVSAQQRYDFEHDRTVRTDLGLTFLNECVLFDVSLSRRQKSSTNVKPVTNINLKLDFLGFGGGHAAGPARVCRR